MPRASHRRAADRDTVEDDELSVHAPARLEVARQVARGGTAVVFRGRDTELDREIALKVLRAEFEGTAHVRRFIAEARTLAEIRDPFVVRTLGFGHLLDGRLYNALEWLAGGALDELVAHRPIHPRTAIAWVRMACRGVAAIHRRGYVHRDIKLENLMLADTSHDARLVVIDLGIASPIGEIPRVAAGTPRHMAPEQRLDAPLDERTDVYALGSVAGALLRHALPDGTPGPLACVLDRALAEAPANRYPNAVAFEIAVARAATRCGLHSDRLFEEQRNAS